MSLPLPSPILLPALVAVGLFAQPLGCSGDQAPPLGAGGTVSGASGTAGAVSHAGGGAGSAGVAGVGGVAGKGGNGGTGGGGGTSSNFFSGTAQIMVLGSSNELATCWRALLWQKLQAAELKDFDFVGDVTEGPGCAVPGYDKDLRATSGTIVTNLTAEQFAGWFTAHPPDALLVHFGGADLLQNLPIDGVIKGYDLMLAQARKVKSTVRVLMGQHTPQDSEACNDCPNTVPALNAEITTWAAVNATAESPIVVVDLFTGIDPASDTSDGIHLNVAGSTKVAERFFTSVSPYFPP